MIEVAPLPVAVCAIAVAVLVAAEWREAAVLRGVAKIAASSAFVWAAITWGALETPYGRTLLAGLVLCWCGDALLLSSGRSRGFLAGIAAFLLGHVAYAIACLELGVEPVWLLLCALPAAGVAVGARRWLAPHVPADFQLPVLAYVGVIAAMLAFTGAAALSGGPPLLAVGAIGFAASDLSVARERFVAQAFWNGAWGLPAYFASQLLIASTVGAA